MASTEWGAADFESTWVDASNGIDSVAGSESAFEVESSPPHGIVAAAGTAAGSAKDHRIGAGKAARGLIDTEQSRPGGTLEDGYYFPLLNGVTGDVVRTACAVHNTVADTSAVTASVRRRSTR